MTDKIADLEVYRFNNYKICQLCVKYSLKSNKVKTRDDIMINQLDTVEVLS